MSQYKVALKVHHKSMIGKTLIPLEMVMNPNYPSYLYIDPFNFTINTNWIRVKYGYPLVL